MNRDPRRGAATGNGLVVLAIACLGASLLWPIVRDRRFDDRFQALVDDVEEVRDAARRFVDAHGTLPEAAPRGQVPAGLASLMTPGLSFAPDGYQMEWAHWEFIEPAEEFVAIEPEILPEEEVLTTADTIPPPPPAIRSFGSLSVHASEAPLLAALRARYGERMSFVRDSSWTLLLPLSGNAEDPPGGNR